MSPCTPFLPEVLILPFSLSSPQMLLLQDMLAVTAEQLTLRTQQNRFCCEPVQSLGEAYCIQVHLSEPHERNHGVASTLCQR